MNNSNQPYCAKLIRLHEHIEEYVVVEIMGQHIHGFATSVPFEIFIGRQYIVYIEFFVIETYFIEVADNNLFYIEQIADSFAYEIQGLLNNGVVRVGDLNVYDEFLLTDYAYLDGKIIRFKVDRIDIDLDKIIHD